VTERAIRTLSDEETDRLKKRYSDLQMSLNSCRTCRGSKKYRAYDGDTVAEFECDCVTQFKLHRLLLHSGIELNYQRLSWTDCVGVNDDVLKEVLDYAQNANVYVNAGMGLLLHGDRGTGKTLLITLLLKMLLGNGFDVHFVTFQELIDMYTQTWRDPGEKAWFDRRLRNAGVLAIDDIGREYKGRLELVESMFDHIIRARVGSARPTLLTTNKTLEELRALYQSNVMSLLEESTIKLYFSGEDYRPKLNGRRVEEVRQGIVRPIVLG
jgi:DNA replication protein DnaC